MFILMRGKGDKQQTTRSSEEEILSKFSSMGKQAYHDLGKSFAHVIYLSRTTKKKEKKKYLNHLERAYQAYFPIANWQEIKPLIKNKPLQHNLNTNDFYVRLIQQMTIGGYRKHRTIVGKEISKRQ